MCTIIIIGVLIIILFIWSLLSDSKKLDLTSYYPFKSIKAKEKYLKYYDNKSLQWPVPYVDKIIKTSQGETFIRISGPEDAVPLVLLQSTSATCLFWIPNIKMLSQYFKTYAIDNIYDFGRSRNTQVLKTPNDLMKWLDELFSTLKLNKNINLMGLSYGGWLTSQYALHSPDRLNKIVIIAPAATLFDLPSEWAWRGIISAIPHKIFMKKAMVDWLLEDLVRKRDDNSRKIIDDYLNDAIMALNCFQFRMPIYPTVLSDTELQSFNIPTLFLIGENEKIYSAQEAINRLKKVAPKIRSEIIPNAGHDLTIIHADLVNHKIIEFLKEN